MYEYIDSNVVKQTSNYYYLGTSDFSRTLFGQILLGFTTFILNFFLSLIAGVILNILSYLKYRSYAKNKQTEFVELQMSSLNNRPTTSKEITQMNQREKTERKIERNMFNMALTLCLLSIMSRLIFMASYVYFFFDSTFFKGLLIGTISNTIFTLLPTASIFVYYSFNKSFRDEAKKKLEKLKLKIRN